MIPKKLMFFYFETKDPQILVDIINSRPFVELEKCDAPESKGFFRQVPQDRAIAFPVKDAAGKTEYVFFNFRRDWKDLPAKPLKEAVKKANDSEFGLSAGVWSGNEARLFEIAHALNAGVVWANGYNLFDPASPFGGIRHSGFGREGGIHGLYPYLRLEA